MSSFILKIIACLTMLIDHAAVVFQANISTDAYWVMRGVGRLAFIIFCLFIVEGFIRTRSRGAYALRLGLFALLSEIPFDWMVYGRAMELSSQNVYLTLLLGLLGLWGFDRLKGSGLRMLVPIMAAVAAELLGADYGAGGVMLIFVMYALREHKLWQGVAVLAVLVYMSGNSAWIEMLAFGGWLLCLAYNGRRGPRMKYIFYSFYPLHMLVLCLIRDML